MFSRRGAAWAWLVLAVLVLPYAAAVLPRCSQGMMEGCADSVGRCAGLWAAGCCDFAAPRPRLQEDPDTPVPAWHAPVIVPVLDVEARSVSAPRADGGPPGSGGPPLPLAVFPVAGAAGSSWVLRL